MLPKLVVQQLIEPLPVLAVDESVLEHAQCLVGPDPNQGLLGLQVVVLHLQDPLENLRQVPQVEGVMRFRRSRQQLLGHPRVHLNRRIRYRQRVLF